MFGFARLLLAESGRGESTSAKHRLPLFLLTGREGERRRRREINKGDIESKREERKDKEQHRRKVRWQGRQREGECFQCQCAVGSKVRGECEGTEGCITFAFVRAWRDTTPKLQQGPLLQRVP